MRLAIAEVSGDPPNFHGGVGRVVRILRDGLRSRGHRVDCLSPSLRIAELKIGTTSLRSFADYDVVHIHGPTPFLSDLVCLNKSVRTLALTYHSDNDWFSQTISRGYGAVHKLLHSKTMCIMVESEAYRQRYGLTSTPIEVIPPPGPNWEPDPDPIRCKDDRFTVLFVGQLRAYKGVDVLIEAAQLAKRVKVVIAGSGRLGPALMKLAAKSENVVFTGPLGNDDLRRAYLAAHVVVLPSVNTSEAFGVSLIEGASLGAVPVASTLPGVTENLSTLAGTSFPVRDARALADILTGLESNRKEWIRRAELSIARAWEYTRHYTETRYIDEHVRIFTNVIENRAYFGGLASRTENPFH